MTKKIITGGGAIILIAFICFCGWLISGSGSTYYTQIDNSSRKESDSGKGGGCGAAGPGTENRSQDPRRGAGLKIVTVQRGCLFAP